LGAIGRVVGSKGVVGSHLEDASVGKLMHPALRETLAAHPAAPGQVFLLGHIWGGARVVAHVDDCAQRRAWQHTCSIQTVHIDELPVADDEPFVDVKKTEALQHIVDSALEAQVLQRDDLITLAQEVAGLCPFDREMRLVAITA